MNITELTTFVSTATEAELRLVKPPTLATLLELSAFIDALTTCEHDYGTCVYAMSLAASAAFNFMAHKLQVTGFQASCADLAFIKHTRNLELFKIVDLSLHLYPQYNLLAELQDTIDKNREFFREKAKAELAKPGVADRAHPDVLAHWQKLAAD